MKQREWLSSLKINDEVLRLLGGEIPQKLKVTEVTPTRIICGPWEFHKLTGGEIDLPLGSDGVNTVISYIRPVDKSS